MKMKKSLLLTFDYELYLGPESGSATNCSFLPTERILHILKKYKCVGIFFVDALYLVRLKEMAAQHEVAKNDFDKLVSQIQEMVKQGNLVFNHLHPHWLDAGYDDKRNSWNLSDKSRFAFSNLSEPEQDDCFERSMNALYDIIKPIDPNYRIDGFRAGGFFIQPFRIFKKQFLKYGIKYDFSVQAGAKCSGPANSYSFDFTNAPDKTFYHFENEVTEEKSNGSFIQFPLRECHVQGFRKIVSGIYYRLTSRYKYWQRYGDGLPSGNQIKFETGTNKPSMFSHSESFSIESMNSMKLRYYLRELEVNNHLHIIAHPKLVSEYTLDVFDSFLKKATEKFELITDPWLIIE
jgi:hypothetical protein